jgi:hypothetical protein
MSQEVLVSAYSGVFVSSNCERQAGIRWGAVEPFVLVQTETREETTLLSPILALVAVASFLPQEMSFLIRCLRQTVARLLILLFTHYLCIKPSKKILAGHHRFVDAFVLLARKRRHGSNHQLRCSVFV